jgi:transcription antitermination factor NusG
MNEGQWFAVYTRPKWEKKVADQLEKKKIKTYCPQNRVEGPWYDRKRIQVEPLFSSYLFVHLKPGDESTVIHLRGVVNFVYWRNSPVIIKDEEINSIRNFVDEYPHIKIEKTQVDLSEDMQVFDGPKMLRKGNLLEVRSNTAKVILPSLGRILTAEIRKEHPVTFAFAQEAKLSV